MMLLYVAPYHQVIALVFSFKIKTKKGLMFYTILGTMDSPQCSGIGFSP